MTSESERRARVSLSFLATPGDLLLGAALRYLRAAEVLAAVTGTDSQGELALIQQPEGRALATAIERRTRRPRPDRDLGRRLRHAFPTGAHLWAVTGTNSLFARIRLVWHAQVRRTTGQSKSAASPHNRQPCPPGRTPLPIGVCALKMAWTRTEFGAAVGDAR